MREVDAHSQPKSQMAPTCSQFSSTIGSLMANAAHTHALRPGLLPYRCIGSANQPLKSTTTTTTYRRAEPTEFVTSWNLFCLTTSSSSVAYF